MGEQLAAFARLEILFIIGAMAVAVFYKGIVHGQPLASLLAGTPGGPLHAERVVLLLATLFGAGQFLSQIIHGDGAALPEVPAGLLAFFAASSGVYLGAKQFRQTPAGGGGAPPS